MSVRDPVVVAVGDLAYRVTFGFLEGVHYVETVGRVLHNGDGPALKPGSRLYRKAMLALDAKLAERGR